MTEAPPTDQAAPPRVLKRSGEGRMITGVCAGLGRYTRIDPVVYRIGFAMLVLGSGIGLFLYIAAFLLMKESNGRPGHVETWTRRDFDAETVFALLTGVAGFGLIINIATVWLGTGTLVVATLMAITLLTAHARGLDLPALARSLPERLNRRTEPIAPEPVVPEPMPVRPQPPAVRREPAPMRHEPPAVHHEPRPESMPSMESAAFNASASSEAEAQAETEAPTRVNEASETPTRVNQVPQTPTRVNEAPVAPLPPLPSYGEPFAPRGPYQPLDPRRRAGYSPYDLSHYGEQVPTPRPRRRRSFTGVVTVLLAMIVGGIVVAAQATSGSATPSLTAVGGAMLITVGAGLLVATWFGRGAGLVALGTVLALVIGAGLMFGHLPRKIGSATWSPTSVAESARVYEVGIGDGTLDLTELELPPGAKTTFRATLSVGELVVIVPPTARVEVHATSRVGDISIGQSVEGGTDLEVNRVLEPEVRSEGKVPTIVLNLKGGVGDLEVRVGA
ncbi:PspC domain-containing protein [Nonomuraea roseola]|uniref:PspC domain-containing protein n=1 Tax=Nonomuraea roseola TaxID=46179 RepID=A0ABV5PQ55_9ACTN